MDCPLKPRWACKLDNKAKFAWIGWDESCNERFLPIFHCLDDRPVVMRGGFGGGLCHAGGSDHSTTPGMGAARCGAMVVRYPPICRDQRQRFVWQFASIRNERCSLRWLCW